MKRIVLITALVVFMSSAASADWVDVPIVNADFETFTGTPPAVNFTGWLQEDMELGTNLGNPTNWAKFNNPGGPDADGNIRQLFDLPVGTTAIKVGFKFRGEFPAGGPTPLEMDAVFKLLVHADDDSTGNLYDMNHVMWSTNETTGWMDVMTSWALPNPVGSISPNARLRFGWDRDDDRLFNSGIDDITVQAVPIPGAVLLGMLGLSVVGVKLRKRA